MERLAEQTVGDVIDALAAPTPAPGGGSSAALACALAAGLAEMTAAIVGRSATGDAGDRLSRLAGRAAELRAAALRLADRELTSYQPVLAAIGDPGPGEGEERVQEALAAASQSPAEIADAAAETCAVAAEVAAAAGSSLRGDATTAVLLAEAAAGSAAHLVEINLSRAPADPTLERARSAADRAAATRAEVLA